MKIYITTFLLLAAILTAEEPEKKVDPVGGREIIELDEGKAYIVTSGDWNYQLEVTIEENGYGIAQLSNDGTGIPPVVVISEGKKIETTRHFIYEDKEVVIMDRDCDGLPELRMTLYKKEGKTTRVKLEDLTIQASIKSDVTMGANQSGDEQ